MRLVRGISLLLFLGLGIYAVRLSQEDRSQAYVGDVVDQLVLRGTASIDQLTKAADKAFQPPIAHHCRSNILRSGLLAILNNLNRFNQAEDYDAWVAAHADAQTYIAAMVGCLPADGNLWLRDALVSRAIAEEPESLKQKMALAQALMPYEELQVTARLFLWKRLTPYTLSVCNDLVRADIRAVLLYGTKAMKQSLDEGASPEFTKLMKAEMIMKGGRLQPASS